MDVFSNIYTFKVEKLKTILYYFSISPNYLVQTTCGFFVSWTWNQDWKKKAPIWSFLMPEWSATVLLPKTNFYTSSG